MPQCILLAPYLDLFNLERIIYQQIYHINCSEWVSNAKTPAETVENQFCLLSVYFHICELRYAKKEGKYVFGNITFPSIKHSNKFYWILKI